MLLYILARLFRKEASCLWEQSKWIKINLKWNRSRKCSVGYSEIISHLTDWKQAMLACPDELSSLEHEVHREFARGADYVIAGLLAIALKDAQMAAAAEQTRQSYAVPLRAGQNRRKRIRLLGGLVIWVTSLYCAVRLTRADQKAPGLDSELTLFGIGTGFSPALESRVAREAVMYPSLRFARNELARNGLEMDVKTVGRITGSSINRHGDFVW